MDLTEQEQNFLKDVLKLIGKNYSLAFTFGRELGMTDIQFNNVADTVFRKLENGRVTFDTGGPNRLI